MEIEKPNSVAGAVTDKQLIYRLRENGFDQGLDILQCIKLLNRIFWKLLVVNKCLILLRTDNNDDMLMETVVDIHELIHLSKYHVPFL